MVFGGELEKGTLQAPNGALVDPVGGGKVEGPPCGTAAVDEGVTGAVSNAREHPRRPGLDRVPLREREDRARNASRRGRVVRGAGKQGED